VKKAFPILMRSKLFVPGSRPDLFAKAVNSEADAISFDLEDAVAPDRKAYAREAIARFLREPAAASGKLTIVRVNALGTPWFEDDIAALAVTEPDVINLPKIESAAQVEKAAATMVQAGFSDGVRLLVNVETPKGIRLAAEIAAANARIIGLQLGLADLFLPLGIDRGNDRALGFLRTSVRLAAGEAGLPVYDAAFTDISRPELCREDAEAARGLGFAGKSCIHPSQVRIVNDVFALRDEEVERAEKIVVAAEEAAKQGSQAFLADGKLIDAPMIAHAHAVLAAARRSKPARDEIRSSHAI
jgi:citrate lyase subunit beta / citryl-CoA lyase